MTKKYLRIIFGLSFITMLGSLYVEHYGDPLANIISGNLWDSSLAIAACNLCWYIRIFTYPIVLISLMGLIYNDKYVARSIGALSIIAIAFCVYKYGLEMTWRSNSDSFFCVAGATSCSEAKPIYGGFMTLSLMGAIINTIILACSYGILKCKD